MLKSIALHVMRAVIVGDVRVAGNTVTIVRAAVTAPNVMALFCVPTVMETHVIHVINATALQNVLGVEVATNVVNAMALDKSIMDMDHPITGWNVASVSDMAGAINVRKANAITAMEQEYGHAGSVMETEPATHVLVADYVRVARETHHIALFVLTVMESVQRVKVKVIHGNTVLKLT